MSVTWSECVHTCLVSVIVTVILLIFFVYACQLLVLPPRKLPILAAHTHYRALHVRYPYSDCTGRSYILGKLSPQIFKFLFDYLVLAHSIQISWYDTNTKVLWSCEMKKWIAFVIDCWIYVLMWPIWRKQSMSLTYVVLCVVGHSYCFELPGLSRVGCGVYIGWVARTWGQNVLRKYNNDAMQVSFILGPVSI